MDILCHENFLLMLPCCTKIDFSNLQIGRACHACCFQTDMVQRCRAHKVCLTVGEYKGDGKEADLGSGPVVEAHKILRSQPQQGSPIDLLNGKAGLDLLKFFEVLVQPAAVRSGVSADEGEPFPYESKARTPHAARLCACLWACLLMQAWAVTQCSASRLAQHSCCEATGVAAQADMQRRLRASHA